MGRTALLKLFKAVGDKGHDIARPQMGIWQFVDVNGIEREVRDLRRAIFGLRRRGQRPGANLAQDRHCLAIGVESGKRRFVELRVDRFSRRELEIVRTALPLSRVALIVGYGDRKGVVWGKSVSGRVDV